MRVDPSWGATPVVNPDLPARKRRRIFEHADLTDPIGIEERSDARAHADAGEPVTEMGGSPFPIRGRMQSARRRDPGPDPDQGAVLSESTPSERYADEASRLDEQLDRALEDVRRQYDEGLITAGEAASQRVTILEGHLAKIRVLRNRYFGASGD